MTSPHIINQKFSEESKTHQDAKTEQKYKNLTGVNNVLKYKTVHGP